ncbi:MAG: thiamine phosphate synthase [Bacteroidetes bacterium]|nr:thiamine phosphate synthase [Bacteroidota bacterium]
MPDSFKLIVISSEHEIANEAQVVSQLFECGLNYFHLRKYKWKEAETETFLNSMLVKFHRRIVLHSHFGLLEKYDLNGIHLNEKNRSEFEKYKDKKIISTSCHSLEDMENIRYTYEYVFFSPVFNSISKPGYTSKFDLRLIADRIQCWKQEGRIKPEVIALGGVEAKNVIQVKALGFSGAAFSGAIWESEDPVKAFAEIQSKINQPSF